MKCRSWLVLSLVLMPSAAAAQHNVKAGEAINVALVKMPYSGARNVPEISVVPDYLEEGGIADMLRELGIALEPTSSVHLTTEEEQEYGEWHRLGRANRHLADIVAENAREDYLTVGLLANCSSLMGMLGGMPVAVSAGLALANLRLTSGLDPALPTRHIVMGAVRDTDPLEQELIARSDIEMITVEDIRDLSANLHEQMERLSQLTDRIYVHIDTDVLDPGEVSGHPLTVPDGPTSRELAAALTAMFAYEKVAALGIASTPAGERDPDGRSREAACNLIRGAVRGVQRR